MTRERLARKRKAEELYEQDVKPLENRHRGEYVAISPRGEAILSSTLRDAIEKASSAFGPGNFIFKVGERSVGKWR